VVEDHFKRSRELAWHQATALVGVITGELLEELKRIVRQIHDAAQTLNDEQWTKRIAASLRNVAAEIEKPLNAS